MEQSGKYLWLTIVPRVIDSEGFRANVGIILCNREGDVLWARRIGQQSWQFPQGGIQQGESAEDALYRELHEEIGLRSEHVEVIGRSSDWLRYLLPPRLVRHDRKPLCIGQKQRWFLLRLTGGEDKVYLNTSDKPEFDHWRWVDYWFPLDDIVEFKREVYQQALHEFAPLLAKPLPTTAP